MRFALITLSFLFMELELKVKSWDTYLEIDYWSHDSVVLYNFIL